LSRLFDRHARGRAWRREPENPAAWSFVREIPNRELWEAHRTDKESMARFVDERLRLQAERNGTSPKTLDPEALVIGFSRRFATYKRATLLLSEPERLRRIIAGEGRPVRFVFAGKAHPADEPAKKFHPGAVPGRRERGVRRPPVRAGRLRHERRPLPVRGVDVWLNNPRRPLEASGTSGQKASLNGAPNFSVLDGWVARGLRRQERLGHRRGEGVRLRGGAGLRRRRKPLHHPRKLPHPPLLRSRRERCAFGVGGDHEGSH
jgi:starch phosphorylase